MIDYIGHTRVVTALLRGLPPVTLLTGPPSVGKWTLTAHVARQLRIPSADQQAVEVLSADRARQVITFCGRAPFGRFKLVRARLDGSNPTALGVLLKTLEEPPATARFLLTASGRVLPTILSRAAVFRVGCLTPVELQQILVRHGLTAIQAGKVAHLGQVRPALELHGMLSSRKDGVTAILRAVAHRDVDAFEQSMRAVDEQARSLLVVALREAMTGTPALFTEADLEGLHRRPQIAARMLRAVSVMAGASARLAVRAALDQFVHPA